MKHAADATYRGEGALFENPEPYEMRFGPQLRKARVAAGRSMGAVALFLGVSATRVSDVELERAAPFDDIDIDNVARFLRIDPQPLWTLAAAARVAWEKGQVLASADASRTSDPPPDRPLMTNAALSTLLEVTRLLAMRFRRLPPPALDPCDGAMTLRWVFRPGVAEITLAIASSGGITWSATGNVAAKALVGEAGPVLQREAFYQALGALEARYP